MRKPILLSSLIAALALPVFAQTGGAGSAAAGASAPDSSNYGGSPQPSAPSSSSDTSGSSMDQTDMRSGATSTADDRDGKHQKRHGKRHEKKLDDRGNPPINSTNPGGDSK